MVDGFELSIFPQHPPFLLDENRIIMNIGITQHPIIKRRIRRDAPAIGTPILGRTKTSPSAITPQAIIGL